MSELIANLSELTGLSERDVRQIALTSPRRYKVYPIKKRNGDDRWIAQPAREVKLLQRKVMQHYLRDLPVHPAATAYKKGTSIRKNAASHLPCGAILKLDFKDFFPSLKQSDWTQYATGKRLFDTLEDVELSGRILFHRPRGSSILRLAIGAPSSPHVSNLLMYEFDRRISDAVASESVTYTRYADGMTFSAARTGFLTRVRKAISDTLSELQSPRLQLNPDKTVTSTKKFRREVTGLILTNDDKLSIGHERKKNIRAKVHHAITGRLDGPGLANLRGLLSFVSDVEPEFILRLEVKYGKGVVEGLMRNSI
jgi:retron-type reverse transcriptase